ncbi:MAG: hypothetical protein ACKVP7_05090 [Hyphomicrobiaceae bacterium]
MPFGKRAKPPEKAAVSAAATGSPPAPVEMVPALKAVPVAPPPSTAEQRSEDLRQAFLKLLADSGNIATAVRENGSIPMRGMDVEIDPLGPPLSLRGFEEFFTHIDAGQTMHSVFVYSEVAALGTLDPQAQLHLQVLTGRILELNRYCQQALKDDALGVALQSPKLPIILDRIIVGTAFFAGFFDTVAIARPCITAKPMRALPKSELERISDSYERHKLMALDRMLAPRMLNELLPSRIAPYVGVETVWAAHAGEQFINGVYFPAEHARPIAAAAAASQISPLAFAV